MNREFIKVGTRVKWVLGALALAIATFSHASTTLVGGGAVPPGIGLAGVGAATKNQVFPAGAGSLFGVYSSLTSNPLVSYCQTGSISGTKIFLLAPGTNVQLACTPNGLGFGANAAGVGRADLTQPNFAVSEVPLTQADVTQYTASHSGDLPVQFPALAAAISIGINKSSTKGVTLSKSNTNFTDAQLCLIFSGQATDWGDSRLASAYSLATGDSVSGPINMQYRSDASGNTFNVSNHLSAVCSGTTAQHFVTSDSFTTVVGLYLPTLPANWSGSSNEHALTQAILNNPGSIGYIGTADSKAAGANYAEVNGQDPEANFGATRFVVSGGAGGNLLFNEVITGVTANTGRPVLAAIVPAPTTACIAIVNPNAYANPSSGYPIMAMVYFLANSQGNAKDLANTQSLMGAPYNAAIINNKALTQFGVNTGYELLNTGAFITAISVSACLVN